MLKNMNKKLNGGTVTHNDVVSVGECIHMYYLFAEPFVSMDKKIFVDVKREPSWPQMLLSVIKKSIAILGRNKLSLSRATGTVADSIPILGEKIQITLSILL